MEMMDRFYSRKIMFFFPLEEKTRLIAHKFNIAIGISFYK